MKHEEPVPYEQFRTGLTFFDVRLMLWSHSDNPKDWPHVSRSTVLGKWREIKQKMYAQYLIEYELCVIAEEPDYIPANDDIPF